MSLTVLPYTLSRTQTLEKKKKKIYSPEIRICPWFVPTSFTDLPNVEPIGKKPLISIVELNKPRTKESNIIYASIMIEHYVINSVYYLHSDEMIPT